ncbi:MAG: four helix bundle protein [bacterium]
MGIARFENIIVWQKAKKLTLQIYSLFETSKDFSFKDQKQRLCMPMNNITKNFELRSKKEIQTILIHC